jgi:arginyl-tRNA synthetase
MRDIKTNVVFDWNKIFLLEGNSGPYLQYTYARCHSVLAKKSSTEYNVTGNENINQEELSILRALVKFPEVIQLAAEKYSPNLLCEYLYKLASLYNAFYNKLQIIGSDNEQFRLALTFGVGQVIKNGLALIGIDTPIKM